MKKILLLLALLTVAFTNAQTVLSTLNTKSPSANVQSNLFQNPIDTNCVKPTVEVSNYQYFHFRQKQNFTFIPQPILNDNRGLLYFQPLYVIPTLEESKPVKSTFGRDLLREFLNTEQKNQKQ